MKRHYPWCLDELDGIRARSSPPTRSASAPARARLRRPAAVLEGARRVARDRASRCRRCSTTCSSTSTRTRTRLQADILEGMRPAGTPRNLTVVGDDAQAIYGFRAATVRNILEFPQRFPGATIVKLERNYRSTPPILACVERGDRALAPAPREDPVDRARRRRAARAPQRASTRPSSATSVCRAVLEQRERGVALQEQAVLFRAAHHSDLLEVELARRNIPFVKYGGLKFLEAAHVKDALALLRVLENPWDEVAWFRVLQLPEGMGPATRPPADGRARRADGRRPTAPSTRHWSFLDAAGRGAERAASEGDARAPSGARRLRRRRGACRRRRSSSASHLPRAGDRAQVRRARRRASPTSISSPCSRRATSREGGSSPS